jgi:hypothetical protein
MDPQSNLRSVSTISTFTVSFALLLFWIAIPITSFAQDEDKNEATTEQMIKQKNVCSGWAICVNVAENLDDSPLVAP